MPRSRTLRGRVAQIINWTLEEFPPPCKITVRFKRASSLPTKERDFGWCERAGAGNVKIVLVTRASSTIGDLAEVWFHELAHALTMRPEAWEAKTGYRGYGLPRCECAHDPSWGVAYAEIYERFHDLEGHLESMEFPEKISRT